MRPIHGYGIRHARKIMVVSFFVRISTASEIRVQIADATIAMTETLGLTLLNEWVNSKTEHDGWGKNGHLVCGACHRHSANRRKSMLSMIRS